MLPCDVIVEEDHWKGTWDVTMWRYRGRRSSKGNTRRSRVTLSWQEDIEREHETLPCDVIVAGRHRKGTRDLPVWRYHGRRSSKGNMGPSRGTLSQKDKLIGNLEHIYLLKLLYNP